MAPAPLSDTTTIDVSVTATNSRNEATSAALLIPVDRVGPTFTLSTMVPTVAVNTLLLSGLVVDGSGNANTLRFDGVSTPLDAQGAFSFTPTIPSTADHQTLTLAVEATDRHGNATSRSIAFVADVVPPAAQWTAPAQNALVTSASLALDFTVTDGSMFTATCDAFGTTASASRVMGDLWRCSVAVPLTEGASTLSVSIQDEAGNQTTLTRNVVVDRVGPTLSLLSPAADSIHRAAFTVTASAGDATSVTAQFDGASVPLTGGPMWTAQLPVAPHDFAPVTLTLTATDANGNATTVTRQLFTDTVAPVITITAPAAGEVFNIADFASTNDVTMSWTITDGDPQAATTTVDGIPHTTNTRAYPTQATWNGNPCIVPVEATDRAGNVGTRDLTFTVDRVAPTVTQWDMPAGGRMLTGRGTLAFSSDVFLPGPDQTAAPLAYVNDASVVYGTWASVAHDTFYVLAGDRGGRVVELSLVPGLADAAGNPVVPIPSRKMHFATGTWLGTGALATNVSTFAVAADADGVVTIAYLALDGRLHLLRDVDGQLVDTSTSVFGTSVTVNSWNTVNPTTLVSTPQFGVDVRSAVATTHLVFTNGALTQLAPTSSGVVVSRTPLSQEPTTASTGLVLGANYTRGSHAVTLPSSGPAFAQSNDSWVAGSFSNGNVTWSKYRCSEDSRIFSSTPRTWTCAGTAFGGNLGVAVVNRLDLTMNRSGTCLLVNARVNNATDAFLNYVWAQDIPNCDGGLGVNPPAACSSNMNMPLIPNAGIRGLRSAPFRLGSVDGILLANPLFSMNPREYRLETMTGCNPYSAVTEAPVLVDNAREYFPAQVGRSRALFFVDTSNELRVVFKE